MNYLDVSRCVLTDCRNMITILANMLVKEGGSMKNCITIQKMRGKIIVCGIVAVLVCASISRRNTKQKQSKTKAKKKRDAMTL